MILPDIGLLIDDYTYTLFRNGMAKRLCEDSRCTDYLCFKNIKHIDDYMHLMYAESATDSNRHTVCKDALVNLFGCCSWLHGGELFGLCYCDITVYLSADAVRHGLPLNVGAILLQLAPMTKSSPSHTADVIIAYQTALGLQPSQWWQHLCHLHSVDISSLLHFMFTQANGAPWTSQHFCTKYLLPLLNMQRNAGDPILLQYVPDSKTLIEKTF
jgi:hypothetical protein